MGLESSSATYGRLACGGRGCRECTTLVGRRNGNHVLLPLALKGTCTWGPLLLSSEELTLLYLV